MTEQQSTLLVISHSQEEETRSSLNLRISPDKIELSSAQNIARKLCYCKLTWKFNCRLAAVLLTFTAAKLIVLGQKILILFTN